MRKSVGVLVLALLLCACAEPGTTDTTLPEAASSTTAAPATSATPAPTTSTTAATVTSTTSAAAEDDLADGSGCTPGPGDLPDGEWYGMVTARRDVMIQFDLACWFSGDAAVQAAAEDGEESPPPNDYYVRNQSPDIRVVPLGPEVEVVFYPDGDPQNETTVDYTEWSGLVEQRGFDLGVWIEIEDGVISEIREQWVP